VTYWPQNPTRPTANPPSTYPITSALSVFMLPKWSNITTHIDGPRARNAHAAGATVATVVRKPSESCSRTSPTAPMAAERLIRGSRAATIDTAMTPCGSWAIVYACANGVKPYPTSSPYSSLAATPAATVRRAETRNQIWLTITKPTVHKASRPDLPRPAPRKSNLGRSTKPTLSRMGTRTTVCATMPTVAPIPNNAVSPAVISPGVFAPDTAM